MFSRPFSAKKPETDWEDTPGLPGLVIPVRFRVFPALVGQKTPKRLAFSVHFVDPPCRPTLSAFVRRSLHRGREKYFPYHLVGLPCRIALPDFLVGFRLVCVPCLFASSTRLLGLPSRLTLSTCLVGSPCRPLSDNRCVAVRKNVSPTVGAMQRQGKVYNDRCLRFE